MSYTRASARKLRFIENMILITFPIVLFAGCAGSDIKPEAGEATLAVYSDKGDTQPTPVLNEKTEIPVSEVTGYDSAPYMFVTDSELTETPVATNTEEDIDESQDTVSSVIIDNTMAVIPESKPLFFDTNKHVLKEEQGHQLEQHANYLLSNPAATLVINGHADIRGTEDYNYELSEKRAKAVYGALIALGVPQSQLTVQAFGELQPVHDENNWGENRRVELDYSGPMVLLSR